MIVIGSHGISGLGGLLGSVAAGVVHHARRPVLVIPEPPRR
jgi:nucleotide-binding universal stress UspA family protein